jgi:hypothetical protein
VKPPRISGRSAKPQVTQRGLPPCAPTIQVVPSSWFWKTIERPSGV